jgi:hypothetical protein
MALPFFQCPQDVFTTGCEALLPVIKEGAFASFFFVGKRYGALP